MLSSILNSSQVKTFKKVPFCRLSVVVESGERVGDRNMSCIFVLMPLQKVRREGAFFMELLQGVVMLLLDDVMS